MDITAKLEEHSLKGVARIVFANIETKKHDKGLLILEIEGGNKVSLNVNNPDFYLVSQAGDYVHIDLEWEFNKELSILTRDLLASGDQKEFTKVELKNLSHLERAKDVIQSFNVGNRVLDIFNAHFTI